MIKKLSRDLSNVTTPHEIEALLRTDFSSFIQRSFKVINPSVDYLHNWHIDVLAEYLQSCEEGEIQRLIINMPPRYLKSIVVSVAWPAWLLGHDPSRRIIVSSYAQGLANKHSMDCRLVMEQKWYNYLFPRVKFSHDQNEKHKFVTTQRGFRLATSTGGSVTGEGGNFLIVDDIHNPINIFSDVKRESDIAWFEHVFSSRLDDKKKGVFVVVMQRLHEDDLSGKLLQKHGWEMLSLPAITEKRTVIGYEGKMLKIRAEGELLHEAREGKEQLENIRQDLGSAAYLAQYQQRPVSLESSLLRLAWFNRYDKMPEMEEGMVVQSWDTAIKGLAQHDYSVCSTWLCMDKEYYLLDVMRDKMEYPALKKRLVRMAKIWSPDVVLVEDKASGQSLIQDIKRETRLPIMAVMPKKDKITRLAAVSALIEAGQVWLPKQAQWLEAFENELLKFPQVQHDDQVDSMSQLLNWGRERKMNAPSVRGI